MDILQSRGVIRMNGYAYRVHSCEDCGGDDVRLIWDWGVYKMVCMGCGNEVSGCGDSAEDAVWKWNDMNREVS